MRNPFSRNVLSATAVAGALALSWGLVGPSRAAEDAVVIPPPAMDAMKLF